MRTEILNYIKQLGLKQFKVSNELPFSNSGTELYLKNIKTIYVDVEQVDITAFIPLLNSPDVDQEVHTIKVFFTTDAKQLPTDYSSVVSLIRLAKDSIPVPHGFRKDVISSTRYENDVLVTEIEFTFARLT